VARTPAKISESIQSGVAGQICLSAISGPQTIKKRPPTTFLSEPSSVAPIREPIPRSSNVASQIQPLVGDRGRLIRNTRIIAAAINPAFRRDTFIRSLTVQVLVTIAIGAGLDQRGGPARLRALPSDGRFVNAIFYTIPRVTHARLLAKRVGRCGCA